MLRPMDWTERWAGSPGIPHLRFRIYTIPGLCVYETKAYEEKTGQYRADVVLHDILPPEELDQTMILRWSNVDAGVDVRYSVRLVGPAGAHTALQEDTGE